MDGISSTPFAAVVPQRIEVSTSLDAVSAQRRGSVPFIAADGPKIRSSTGPSSVRPEVPAIVQTYVGTSRAATGDLGDTAAAAAKENVAPDIVALDVAVGTDGKTQETKKKGHARGQSFFGRLSFKRSNSSMEAKQAKAKDQGPPERTGQAGAMPDEMAVLVRADEIEETALDAENRPPLVDEKKQKKGKSGGLFACIKPRTEGE